MKPVHSFPRPQHHTHETARLRRHLEQPRTDYSYQTNSFGNARSEGRETPSSQRSNDQSSYLEVRNEARRDFYAEAALFTVIAIIAGFGLVVCAAELWEFLRLITAA